MQYTQKKVFYPNPLSFSSKLFFDVGNTLTFFSARIWKDDWKNRFRNKSRTTCQTLNKKIKTCQILKQKFYNALDFEMKKTQPVSFWFKSFSLCQILRKNVHSINHVLVYFAPWNDIFCIFVLLLKAWFWIEKKTTRQNLNIKNTTRQIENSSDWKFFDLCHFELKILQRVRFWNKTFSSFLFLNSDLVHALVLFTSFSSI